MPTEPKKFCIDCAHHTLSKSVDEKYRNLCSHPSVLSVIDASPPPCCYMRKFENSEDNESCSRSGKLFLARSEHDAQLVS